MGKAKKKKHSAAKPRPTGLPSVGECEAELELVGECSSASLQGIVDKLQSPGEESRECACTTIAGIVSQPGAVASLLKLNIIKILAPLVLDHSWDVRHRAVGALRNISVDGGVDVCEEMIKQDVLTPLMALIHQFGSGDQFAEGEKQRRKDMICEAYAHAFHLLLNLCENSGLAVSMFNKENILPIICHILDSGHCTEVLVLATVQCLHTVTEDNKQLCRPELVESVQRLMSRSSSTTQQMLIKILATGVLVNLEGAKLSNARGDLVTPIVGTVAEMLGQDLGGLVQVLQETGQEAGSDSEVTMEATGEEQGDLKTDNLQKRQEEDKSDSRVDDLRNVLQGQKVALEIATNLCCTEDDDWEDMGSSESSSDEIGDEACTDEEMATDDTNLAQLCVSTELHTAYVNCEIVPKVLQAARSMTPEQEQTLGNVPGGKGIIKQFVSHQTHALLCFNNLVGSLDGEALGGVDRLFEVWLGLLELSKTPNCGQNQELLESVTCAMRAVIQKLAEIQPAKFENVQGSNLQFMYEMASRCEWPEVRTNSLRIVSTIGAILAQNQTPHVLLKDIGVFLLEIVCKDTDLRVVAEALDAIFDVFGEDHIDTVVKEIDLVQKLKTIAPQLKAKIQTNRKSLGEHYPVISTARTNLVRFIKYKMSK